jgi:hypothetical protein
MKILIYCGCGESDFQFPFAWNLGMQASTSTLKDDCRNPNYATIFYPGMGQQFS